jgi:hypothetical protein
MFDPIQRTQERLVEEDKNPNSPVIPMIPTGSKKSVTPSPIPGLPEGKDLTLVHGTTIPITISESTPGLGIAIGKDRKVLLDIGPGVNVLFLDGKLRVRANALTFLGLPFLIAFTIACVAIAVAVVLGFYFKYNQAPAPPQPENKSVTAPRTTPIVTPAINDTNNLAKPATNEVRKEPMIEVSKDLLNMDDQDFVRTYDDPSELYKLIADKDEAIKVYEEAVQLRKTAAQHGNDAYRMRQSSIRLQALLSQSNLPYGYQRHAAKQLWVIYHCHWQNARLAKEALALLDKYNKKASAAEKVIVACPKEGE